MFPKLSTSFYLTTILTSIFTFLLFSASQPKENKCTVIITGESIRILGCTFSEGFLEYAKGLDVLRV
uniref:Movement protein TGBp3 n=1 Tax=Nerine latent virus TaxID=797075 RepID=A0A8E6YJ61_9VIRU|nr:triple gene block protein 3 [Nerine latent virus]